MNIVPQLYDESNFLQQKDANELFTSIAEEFRNRKVKSVIDVGCGTGNVTADILRFTDCDKLIAFDKSDSMIEFARQRHRNAKISFQIADICDEWSKLKSDINLNEEVDVVFSVHCLHWITDKAKAIENISKMLKPGGQCYALLFFWSDILPLQEQITHFPKWNKYFSHLEKSDVTTTDKCLSPGKQRRRSSAPFPVYLRSDEQATINEWKSLCDSSGFSETQVSVKKSVFCFDDFTGFKDEVTSLCHFLRYIPDTLKQEFLNDYFDHVKNCYTSDQKIHPKVELRYECLIICATKSANKETVQDQ
ncbi:phosphomethylethanolamine N-methyltransferase-like protein [Leptotrombidium deliense]|uniref:Phosphomethylethanolamine N-methyltransferase-like protein n=1 Tax=Leptotrombidium deliense TaxID=299467 RepID=A0A443S391_9ACAR|nr:phosphomethylethanolamine N-methyltransferase-like protein [Leptotrombidium deliense]